MIVVMRRGLMPSEEVEEDILGNVVKIGRFGRIVRGLCGLGAVATMKRVDEL